MFRFPKAIDIQRGDLRPFWPEVSGVKLISRVPGRSVGVGVFEVEVIAAGAGRRIVDTAN